MSEPILRRPRSDGTDDRTQSRRDCRSFRSTAPPTRQRGTPAPHPGPVPHGHLRVIHSRPADRGDARAPRNRRLLRLPARPALHGMPFDELWQQVSRPRVATSPSRFITMDLLAAVTGLPETLLTHAVIELRRPEPDWLAHRHEAQRGCPRCTARHPGGPVLQLLGHHPWLPHRRPDRVAALAAPRRRRTRRSTPIHRRDRAPTRRPGLPANHHRRLDRPLD